uniref:MMS19 nucleotide excision repair protein n=1 Tax=Astyanax mexicanus TaxID=7994 RepID=A0A8B9HLF0_ASTMX
MILLFVFRISLTSSQSQTRGRGVQLLSEVLQECYSGLSEREVEVLIAFYENRLKDHYAITPHVLRGLKALAKSTVLPPGSDGKELKGLGPDFVFGFVQAVDGERDPRNLLLAFQIARNIIHRGYDLSQFTEEFFEVTSCYFPIDFTPPPNDAHGITQEELILALRGVLTGTPRFAEKTPKLTNQRCAVFVLNVQVFQTASERVESAGLAALAALTSCLSRSVLTSDSEDALQTFLDQVLKDCQHHLYEPDLKLVWPSAKLLQAACGASYRSSLIVTAAVLPTLLDQYSSRTQVGQDLIIIIFFYFFYQNNLSEESVLLPFQVSLCSAVFSALAESSAGLQITATKVLATMGQQPVQLLELIPVTLNGDPSIQRTQFSAQHRTQWSQGHIQHVIIQNTVIVIVFLFGNSLCLIRWQVDVPDVDRLLGQLEELSCSCSHAFSYTSAAKCFAGLINKRAIFSLLSDPQLGSQAADSFSLLMSDSPDVLNRSCHADVRIMYRQRFFAENSAKLVQGFNCAEQESKSVYLKALSHIVNNLPRQVQLSELPALLPLLLEALSCPDQAVQLSTLSCLQPVLLDPPPALTTQLEALFSRLLALTSSPAMKVRMAALRCVHALSRLPEHMVLPFRARVLRALAPPLDDKKRLVRKEAVSARGEWFLLGSPGGR